MREPRSTSVLEPPGSHDPVREALARAVTGGVIDQAQADAILRAEGLEPGSLTPESRVRPLVAEALGYLGAVLALVSAVLVVQRFWDDLAAWSRVSLVGAVAVALTAAGMFVRVEGSDALARLGSLLWLAAAGAVAAFTAVVAVEVLDLEGEEIVAMAGGATAVFGAVLWRLRRRSLQQLAVFGGLMAAAIATLAVVDDSLARDYGSLLAWAIGIGWLLLAYAGVLAPVTTGYALGAAAALASPFFGAAEDTGGWILLVGLATAGGLVAASIPLRRTVLLGIGTAGLFAYVPRIVFTYLGDALGPPVALFLSGLVLVAVAVGLTRLRPGPRDRAGDEPGDPSGTDVGGAS